MMKHLKTAPRLIEVQAFRKEIAADLFNGMFQLVAERE